MPRRQRGHAAVYRLKGLQVRAEFVLRHAGAAQPAAGIGDAHGLAEFGARRRHALRAVNVALTQTGVRKHQRAVHRIRQHGFHRVAGEGVLARHHGGEVARVTQRTKVRHKGPYALLGGVAGLRHEHAVFFSRIRGSDQAAAGCAHHRHTARLGCACFGNFGKKGSRLHQLFYRRHNNKSRALEQGHVRFGGACQ